MLSFLFSTFFFTSPPLAIIFVLVLKRLCQWPKRSTRHSVRYFSAKTSKTKFKSLWRDKSAASRSNAQNFKIRSFGVGGFQNGGTSEGGFFFGSEFSDLFLLSPLCFRLALQYLKILEEAIFEKILLFRFDGLKSVAKIRSQLKSLQRPTTKSGKVYRFLEFHYRYQKLSTNSSRRFSVTLRKSSTDSGVWRKALVR